jgi:hypothetical protein
MTKRFASLSLFLIFTFTAVAQKTFRTHKTPDFRYEFTILKDSTCFIRGIHKDSIVYLCYKGRLKRKNDTLFEFKFRPLVQFTLNFSPGASGNYVSICLRQKDTVITDLNYFITEGNLSMPHDMEIGCKTINIPGWGKRTSYFETKFKDPITREEICIKSEKGNDPDLTFFGKNTPASMMSIIIVKDNMSLIPDNKYFSSTESFLLVK